VGGEGGVRAMFAAEHTGSAVRGLHAMLWR
jgi:hypothetical protein